ncbi:5522_t:CDS:2 [Diversispora eburnea]|uniref:5522_t:CDS:1 n=1 Tax=Diversispora eburnea TaxID=1213867 RepID=A0A9N8ZL43_9GLOM|nr:5522_t:CDS:2 [Diversispora eburnea]
MPKGNNCLLPPNQEEDDDNVNSRNLLLNSSGPDKTFKASSYKTVSRFSSSIIEMYCA